jgi:hypothetical protein
MDCRLHEREAEGPQVRTALVLIACVVFGSLATARESVSIRVSPNVSLAPATVRVVVTVEPEATNRQLVLEADSGLFFTSSTVQLDGTNAPRLQSFVFKELPAGNYEIAARVIRNNGNNAKALTEYMVME